MMAAVTMSVGLGAGCDDVSGGVGDGVEVGLSVVVDDSGVGEAVGPIDTGTLVGSGVAEGVAGM